MLLLTQGYSITRKAILCYGGSMLSDVRVVHMAQFFSTKENYTVSQKTTLMLHNITSTHISRFWQFLTETLLREYAIEPVLPPHLTTVFDSR